MNDILNINLKLLSELNKDNKLNCIDNVFIIDVDFVSIKENDIYLLIINTLLLSFKFKNNDINDIDEKLNLINLSLDNIYNNKYLTLFINDECEKSQLFRESLDVIEYKLEIVRNKYDNKCNRLLYHLNNYFDIILNKTINISKEIYRINIIINGSIYNNSDSDSDSGSDYDDISGDDEKIKLEKNE
jgi:hypothetical protein